MYHNLKSIVSVFYFLAAFVIAAKAAVVENEKRQIDSVFNSLTSGAGSIIGEGTSAAGSIFSEATNAAGNIATVVTSVGGQAITVITSAGGEAITLGSDHVTSFAGSVYSVATGNAASLATQVDPTPTESGNAAVGMHAISISTPLLGCLLTVFASMLMGAWVVL